jgi:cell pole-organizing protein PopZ
MPDNPKTPTEPSMEEIIASISRIITEDKRPIEPLSPASDEKPGILELTEVVNKDGSVRRVTPFSEKTTLTSAASVDAPSPSAANGVIHSKAQTDSALDPDGERILSSATSEAVATAFAQLGALPRDHGRASEPPFGGGARTLEDVVRDLLRPLLQSWLDEHLLSIVERLVREEITRVAREARLR